jgi:hypothetical protein
MKGSVSRPSFCSLTRVEFQKTIESFLIEGQQICESNPSPGITSQYRYISPKLAQAQHEPERETGSHKEEVIRIFVLNSLGDQYLNNSPDSCNGISGQLRSYSRGVYARQQNIA